MHRLGAAACRGLLDRIEDPTLDPGITAEFPMLLVERESTAARESRPRPNHAKRANRQSPARASAGKRARPHRAAKFAAPLSLKRYSEARPSEAARAAAGTGSSCAFGRLGRSQTFDYSTLESLLLQGHFWPWKWPGNAFGDVADLRKWQIR